MGTIKLEGAFLVYPVQKFLSLNVWPSEGRGVAVQLQGITGLNVILDFTGCRRTG